MTDHKQDNNNNNQYDPSLMDTQRLLLGVQPPEEGTYDLDEILAEFGSRRTDAPSAPEEPAAPALSPDVPAAPPAPEPEPPAAEIPAAPEPEPSPEHKPARKWFSRRSRPSEAPKAETPPQEQQPEASPHRKSPSAAAPVQEMTPAEPLPEVPEIPVEDDVELTEEDLLDLAFWSEDDLSDIPETMSAAGEQETSAPAEPPPAQKEIPAAKPPRRQRKASSKTPPVEEPPAVSMEDIVASTVDAVKIEQEKRQERLRKHLDQIRRKDASHKDRPPKTPASRQPLPEVEREPASAESAGRHKRMLRQCRRALFPAVLVLILLWLPWVLTQSGVTVPFFSTSADNAALCVLVFQAAICFLCWPVYRMAAISLKDGCWTIYATALLTTIVTLMDEMTMLLLPGRTDAAPLGGVAACLSVFSLWGLTSWHKGMAETFRIAAMGEPTRVVDHTPHGVAKGRGSSRGFFIRTVMEDTTSQWQRLLLPMLAVASLVFAGLASIGQDRPQDFLWCWSAVLCASSSPVFLLSYCVPFGRVASYLARDGAAVAGMYGASTLSADPRLVVTDTDLFPTGSAVLAGVKLYGEDRDRALSYAGSLASQGGGLLARVFEDACRTSLVIPQNPEHFHIHEDGGFSGMIQGETILLGTPSFMRRHAVRLPPTLPTKLAVCLAVDGNLTAIFGVRYKSAEPVEYALRILHRAGFRLTLATRDINLNAKLIRARFGTDCGAQLPELGDRLSLSAPDWSPEGPSGLLYRDGILPFANLVTSSGRLCQTARIGNIIAIFSSIAGALLAFYLTFAGTYSVLTPLLVLTYVLLWVAPMLPLVWTVDKA